MARSPGSSSVHRSKESERKVANWLADYTGVSFRRRRVEGKDVGTLALESTGDVIALRPGLRFNIEVKIGKGFSLDALMANPRTALFTEWWHQATYDASLASAHTGKIIQPLLFFRPWLNNNWVALPVSAFAGMLNRAGSPACLDANYLSFAGYREQSIALNVLHSKKKKGATKAANVKIVALNLVDVVFVRWHDFAANVDPGELFFPGALAAALLADSLSKQVTTPPAIVPMVEQPNLT